MEVTFPKHITFEGLNNFDQDKITSQLLMHSENSMSETKHFQ